PGLIAFHSNAPASPGITCVTAAPPPGPVTACRSIECALCAVVWFLSLICTVSPSRTRSNGPGTVPPNVQNVYSTPLASVPFCSVVSSSDLTLAGAERWIAGGTPGGASSTAFTSPPTGSPRRCAATVPARARITTVVTTIARVIACLLVIAFSCEAATSRYDRAHIVGVGGHVLAPTQSIGCRAHRVRVAFCELTSPRKRPGAESSSRLVADARRFGYAPDRGRDAGGWLPRSGRHRPPRIPPRSRWRRRRCAPHPRPGDRRGRRPRA